MTPLSLVKIPVWFEHHPDEEGTDHEHDPERDRDEEGELHRRPEVDVDELQANLLRRGRVASTSAPTCRRH